MKKTLLFLLVCSLGLFSTAQTKFQVKNNLKECKAQISNSPDAVMENHSFITEAKKTITTTKGADVITVIDIGQAGNAYGLYNGGKTCVCANNDINSVTFTHRMLATPGTGFLAYDVSTDGGSTWTNNNQVYEAPSALFNARYPQGAIYNPEGNTDPSQAFLAYFAAVLDGSNGDNWGGYGWGGNFLTTIPPTPIQTNLASRPGEGYYQNVPDAFHITPQGKAFVIDPSVVDGFFVNYTGDLILTKGEFNPEIGDFEYEQSLFNAPITSDPVDATIASTRIAFSPDGTIGYMAMLANNGENTDESYGCYYPILYKSTDGGETWDDEPINVQLGGPDGIPGVLNYLTDEIIAAIFLPPVPSREEIPFSTAFDLDLVVDGFGYPHILCVICVGSQEWSIYTHATGEPCNGWIGMFHLFSYDDEMWMGDTLTTPNTFRGEFGGAPPAGIAEDNRPQISMTPDGLNLFFSWIDTDVPEVVDNINPDIYCVGHNIVENCYSILYNVSYLSAAMMSSYMATQSYYVFQDGDNYEIPFVYQAMNPLDPTEPVQFKYIKDFVLTKEDLFVIPGIDDNYDKQISFVSQNYPNPFNATSVVTVNIDNPTLLSLEVYNMMGQKVFEIPATHYSAGVHTLTINASDMSNGVYFYTVFAGEESVTKKMIVN